MKSLTALIVILLALCWSTPAQTGSTPEAKAQALATREAEWERYTYPGEEFSVLLPEMPSLFHTVRNIKGSYETETARMYSAYQDGTVFIVTAYDKPHKGESLDFFINEFNGGNKSSKEGQEINRGSYPGKQYLYNTASSGTSGAELFLLTKKHAYFVRSFSDQVNNPAVRRFVDSFILEPQPKGKTITGFTDPLKYTYVPTTGTGVSPTPTGALSVSPTQTAAPNVTPQTNAQTTNGPDDVFPPKLVTRKAIIYARAAPGFTEAARQNNVMGIVRLRVVLSSSGKVNNIVVMKDLPDGLTEKAANAARHIAFIPAAKDGRRVSQYVTLEYNFNIY